MGFVDLHVHSNASDGTLSPSQVVSAAYKAGLTAIALTDHDTTAGIAEAEKKAQELGLELVPGIEVSSTYEDTEIHILGLFVHPEKKALQDMLQQMLIWRDNRNQQMLANLAADGISFSNEELCGDNPDTIVTRAHIAKALIAKGRCTTMDQAFKRYLACGGRYCPKREHFPPEAVVHTLVENGAFVALAHPFQYKLGDREVERLIAQLTRMGMKGLEVYHSSHSQYDSQKLQIMAAKYRLLPTGGSDFHGANKPDISIGTGRGGLRVCSLLLESIKSSLQSRNFY